MNLEGIGAISAAAVAAIGIPTALIVGRWQLKGALRTAEEAGRVGIAQAESSYRGALDAVRTEANNAHSQWRRGIRRDAYAAFLVATTRAVQAASALPRERLSAAEDLTTPQAALRIARNELNATFWVVKLEGPLEVSEVAGRVCVDIYRLLGVKEVDAEQDRAMYVLNSVILNEIPDTSVDEETRRTASRALGKIRKLREAVRRHGYQRRRTSAESMPEEVAEIDEALRRELSSLDTLLSSEQVRALLGYAFRDNPDPMTLDRAGNTTIQEFIAAAQTALDLPAPPTI
ncbi:hypothetical protein [Streptomyces sp. NPDC005799]|uniref:hypothetical protein n=1 Tax=Streptomyces sp. NPDC005799 TaxID=3154678 RepID=UPI0033CC1DC6